MRFFAPDPETIGDVTALRVFQRVSWTPQHRAGWRQDPLAKISTLLLGVGAMLVLVSILGLVGIWIYITVL